MNDADGGDSDVEGEEFEIFDSSYAKAVMERRTHDVDGLHIKEINNGDIAFVMAEDGVFVEDGDEIDLNDLVKKQPDDWVRPKKKQVMNQILKALIILLIGVILFIVQFIKKR